VASAAGHDESQTEESRAQDTLAAGRLSPQKRAAELRERIVCATQPRRSLRLPQSYKENQMFFSSFLIIFIALIVAWLLGGFVFHIAGGLIHILLVVAVISLIVHFVRGRP
jgi:fatty acid desaturase